MLPTGKQIYNLNLLLPCLFSAVAVSRACHITKCVRPSRLHGTKFNLLSMQAHYFKMVVSFLTQHLFTNINKMGLKPKTINTHIKN